MGLTRASIPRATPGRPLTARRGADKRRENRRTGHQVMPMGLARASIPQATPGCQGVATGQITSAGKTVGNIPPSRREAIGGERRPPSCRARIRTGVGCIAGIGTSGSESESESIFGMHKTWQRNACMAIGSGTWLHGLCPAGENLA